MHFYKVQTHKQVYKNERVITYLDINKDTESNYRAHIEITLMESKNYNIHNLEILMKEASQKFLNKQTNRRINHDAESTEPEWITSEIRKEMSK